MYTTKQKGFTIVELLIVIVVIAILAAISIVAFTGIQQRGRDTERASDVSNIVKSLTAYTSDGNSFPATPADAVTELGGYESAGLPSSIASRIGTSTDTGPGEFNYAYTTCGSSPVTGAQITWVRESNDETVVEEVGTGCPTTP